VGKPCQHKIVLALTSDKTDPWMHFGLQVVLPRTNPVTGVDVGTQIKHNHPIVAVSTVTSSLFKVR
jgi:hypothetical protein